MRDVAIATSEDVAIATSCAGGAAQLGAIAEYGHRERTRRAGWAIGPAS